MSLQCDICKEFVGAISISPQFNCHKCWDNVNRELETTKKLLEELQIFIHRFQEEFYLNNSASGLSKLYADIVKYDLAKLSKEERV